MTPLAQRIVRELTLPLKKRWDGRTWKGAEHWKRALHFCRAHLRIRRGQLEFVKSHWRGDPALGMKQSRYKVVPPRITKDGDLPSGIE